MSAFSYRRKGTCNAGSNEPGFTDSNYAQYGRCRFGFGRGNRVFDPYSFTRSNSRKALLVSGKPEKNSGDGFNGKKTRGPVYLGSILL
jgi:hypothetical protein